MADRDSSGEFVYADEEVFIGKKRTQREIIKSTLMGQNYESPVGKPSSSATCHLPDVINISSEKHSAEQNGTANSSFSLGSQNDDDVIIIESDSLHSSPLTISDDDTSGENLLSDCGTARQNLFDCEPKTTSVNSNAEYDAGNKDVSDMKTAVGISHCVSESDVSQHETNRLENWKTLLEVIPDLKASSKETEGSAGLSIDALLEASRKLEAPAGPVAEDSKLGAVGNPTLDGSTFSSFDFSLLTGVSDSVLDISHGSSLPSPAVERKDSSLGLLASAVYEDISCDGDHMFDISMKQPKAEVDLHMSVDETDDVRQGRDQQITASSNVTTTTFYKSCLSDLGSSVYTTANNTVDLSALNQPSSAFSDYRDTFADSLHVEGMDNVDRLVLDNDNKNETSFEIVLSNRQNSFTNSVVASTKTENIAEKEKPKLLPSKLPVSSNLLKPSSLQSNLDSKLIARNFKWARTLPKPNEMEPKKTRLPFKTNKTLSKTSSEHVSNSEPRKQEKKTPAKNICIQKPTQVKTPSNRLLGKPTSSNGKTPCKTIVNEPLAKSRPTSSNKTPANRTPSQLSNLPTPDIKTPKGSRLPVSKLLSSGKRNDNSNLLVDKERYKNVISPVRAYINNAPITMLRKVHVPEEQILLMGGSISARKPDSQTPKPPGTPLHASSFKTTSIPVKSSSVAQKLVYSKTQDQENMDPNYTREWRYLATKNPSGCSCCLHEPEPPKRHLPKIGESMQKLIDTPRPKVIVHQGRVKESPRTKGVLIPSLNIVPSTPEHQAVEDSRISVRVVKSAEHSNN